MVNNNISYTSYTCLNCVHETEWIHILNDVTGPKQPFIPYIL